MKVFITGVNGQLGYDVANELLKKNHQVVGSDISDYSDSNCDYFKLDITDEKAVFNALDTGHYDAVIHCAAWTNVDGAEDEENREKVYAINHLGTANIAAACKKNHCKMMYISTDYVFSGQGTEPWKPDCNSFEPLNQYGQSKLKGEDAVRSLLEDYYIVRIAWVFGTHGNNFVKTILRIGKQYKEIRVVDDQIGTPTYTYDLARLLADMIETDRYGCYHVTNEGGFISWYDFACSIIKLAGYETKVIPVTTEEYGLSKATRPFNSRLDKSKLREKGFEPLPNWDNALERFIKTSSE